MVGFFLSPGAFATLHPLEGLDVKAATSALIEVLFEKSPVMERAFHVVCGGLRVGAMPLMSVHLLLLLPRSGNFLPCSEAFLAMRVLVTGASGKLGCYLMKHEGAVGCGRSGPDYAFDLLESGLERRLDEIAPQVVIHSAALSAIADCLREPERADTLNRAATLRLSRWCAAQGVRLVYVSTDMVFDGESAPYNEDSPAEPLSEYGRSKLRGEGAVLEDGHLVARVALMVGPALGKGLSYYDQLVANLRSGKAVSLFQDEWRGMISYEDAAQGLFQLALGKGSGIVHLAGPRLSRLEMGRKLAVHLGIPELVSAGQRADYPSPEPRPRDLTMVSRRWGELLPGWRPRTIDEQIYGWLS